MEQENQFYRLGYQAAMHAKYRCREYDQILGEMQADLEEVKKLHPHDDVEEAFLQGFERGRNDYQDLCTKGPD